MSAKAQVRNSDKAKTRLQVIANHLALQNNKHSEKSEEKQQVWHFQFLPFFSPSLQIELNLTGNGIKFVTCLGNEY